MQVIENTRVIDTLAEVPAEVSWMRGAGVDVAYDIETTSTDPLTDLIVALQFKPKGKQAMIVDVRQFTPEMLLNLGSMLEPLFDGSVTLVGQNLKFDMEFAWSKMKLAGHKAYDMLLAEQVILGLGFTSAGNRGIHLDMGSIAKRYGISVEKESRNWFIHLDQRPEDWAAPFPLEQVRYMRQDVSVPHKVAEQQWKKIAEYGLQEVIDLEMRALFPLVGIEWWGVEIDRIGWLDVIKRVKAVADDLEKKLHNGVEGQYDGLDIHVMHVRNERYWEKWHPYHDWYLAREAFIATEEAKWPRREVRGKGGIRLERTTGWGEEKSRLLAWYDETHEAVANPGRNENKDVNLGSWKQVRDGFNDLGIPVELVNEGTLTSYIGTHPLVETYIDYQHAHKIVTVYGPERGKKKLSFIERLDANNRLRASYQQIGTDTGRYSSNFQQVPVDGVGRELRRYVIAAKDSVFLVADFSNIELRILAELSGDPVLLAAFASGVDIHSSMAVPVFGLTPEQATKEWADSHNVVLGGKEVAGLSYRKVLKVLNYTVIYGGGPKGIAAQLHTTSEIAKSLKQTYESTYAVAIAYLKKLKSRLREAQRNGEDRVYSTTKSGRRRWFSIPKYPTHPAHGQQVSVEDQEKWDKEVEDWGSLMAYIERQLANSPIQGLCADMIKLFSAYWYEEVGYMDECRLVALIHDEGIVEVKDPDTVMFPGSVYEETRAEYAARMLEGCMMDAMKTYLHKVDCGTVKATRTPYWKHD
jgi:DNA polymerase-1